MDGFKNEKPISETDENEDVELPGILERIDSSLELINQEIDKIKSGKVEDVDKLTILLQTRNSMEEEKRKIMEMKQRHKDIERNLAIKREQIEMERGLLRDHEGRRIFGSNINKDLQ